MERREPQDQDGDHRDLSELVDSVEDLWRQWRELNRQRGQQPHSGRDSTSS